jgi:hypothetical protein
MASPPAHDVRTCVCVDCVAQRRAVSPAGSSFTGGHTDSIQVAVRVFFVVGGLALLVLLVVSILRSDSDAADEGGTESTAQGIAVLDAESFVPPDDPSVHKYQRVLNQLRTSTCVISEERVADMAVASRERLATRGVDLDHFDVLSGTLRLAASSPPPRSASAADRCAHAFTMFILDST